MENIIKRFDSVGSFNNYLLTEKVTEIFPFPDAVGSTETGRDALSFTTTKDFEEAQNLMLSGDMGNFEKIKKVSVGIDRAAVESVKRNIMSIVGSSISVGAYLAGKPNYFHRKVKQTSGSKVIDLYINNAMGCNVSAKDMIQAAAVILAAIEDVEKKGYKINLYSCVIAESDKQYAGMIVKIKNSGEYFNRLKLAYFLVNPSFIRRHYFRFVEVTKGLNKRFAAGYGYPVSDNKKIAALIGCKENEVISLSGMIGKTEKEILKEFEKGIEGR
jgi:hypothetical protein